MGNERGSAVADPTASGPDYNDLSDTAVAYRWVPRDEGRENRPAILAEFATGLEEYAAEQGARLVGAMTVDFPRLRDLPKDVRRSILRTMWLQERRWWRWGDLVLVRAWQHTEPA
ncbi:hypothetical protein [Streptomyces xanthii]|uniref:Uncharacterized protein n=1 Tax=Streptomyces xanthii TaxID=2768069 RepID=A0A7H1BL38_9ACTN|nr:hypothetical protein [Streptomyces xanthii]QNS09443.1 hypothetical protein IAG42_37405 [Streptomyces xanthii]